MKRAFKCAMHRPISKIVDLIGCAAINVTTALSRIHNTADISVHTRARRDHRIINISRICAPYFRTIIPFLRVIATQFSRPATTDLATFPTLPDPSQPRSAFSLSFPEQREEFEKLSNYALIERTLVYSYVKTKEIKRVVEMDSAKLERLARRIFSSATGICQPIRIALYQLTHNHDRDTTWAAC